MPKLPAKYNNIIMPLLLSTLMTMLVSFISTVKIMGITPHFFSIWLSSWGVSWVIAFPTLLVLLPIVKKITTLLVHVK
jgi:hypothetical protein